ncbi:MAG: RloB domain-containing protein [Ferruginibacter sp.]|nr:RloB domain-containing protein [Ferruginibacter sp.]
MAGTINIDDALQQNFTFSKEKRSKNITAYFLIVCEGEKTEPNYFRSFPKQAGKVICELEFSGGGISTLKVVEKAIELRDNSLQKYDRVWAVFDRDSFKSNAFNSAILKAEANGIECAWSNEAFELWYLLHFHNRVTAMKRGEYQKAIEKAVNGKVSRKRPFKYKKNDTGMYKLLNELGSQDMAVKWATALCAKIPGKAFAKYNPVTQVYKLVQELAGKSPELINELMEKYKKGV